MEGDEAQAEAQMKVFLKAIKTIPIIVDTSATIENIKAKVSDMEGVSVNQQELFFAGNHLKDNRTLFDYGIPNNSTMNLYIGDGMRLFVKIPSISKTNQLEVKRWDTVGSVKSKILSKEGIPINQQVLIHLGKSLEDDSKALSAHNIGNDAMISIVLRTDELQVSVIMVCGKTFKLQVRSWYTIGDVKIMIESLEGIPLVQYRFIHDGKELEESLTLLDQKIGSNSILQLVDLMQIFIKGLSWNTVTLMVGRLDTVAEVLDKAERKTGIRAKNQRVVYMGRFLVEYRTLADYDVRGGSTIQLRDHASVLTDQIFADIQGGDSLSLYVALNSIVKDVKAMIQEKTRIPTERINLSFDGESLSDDKSLAYYDVQGGSRLRVT